MTADPTLPTLPASQRSAPLLVPHTIVVDFAVALLVTSVAFDLLGALAEEPDLRTAGWWTLLFGTVAAAFSVFSGYDAAVDAPQAPPVGEVVVLHRNLGIATLVAFAACALWRGARGGGIPDGRLAALYWATAVVGVVLLTVTAYYGGTLVFRFGVGVSPTP